MYVNVVKIVLSCIVLRLVRYTLLVKIENILTQ